MRTFALHALGLATLMLAAACGSVKDDGGPAADAGGGGGPGENDAGACPASAPNGEACTGTGRCTYGTETCCGKTYPSTVCDCMGGKWGCAATDACMIPPDSCADGGGPACTSDGECTAPASCQLCPDGTSACAQARCAAGQCEVVYPSCPAVDAGPDAAACPADAPIGSTCSGNLHCEYGTETCCGKTYPSTVCDCLNGSWGCYATDACLLPPDGCPDGGSP